MEDKQEIADRLKDASDDEMKMQELVKELRDRGHDPAAEIIDRFRFDLWNNSSRVQGVYENTAISGHYRQMMLRTVHCQFASAS
jgi:hypothetical protein